MSLPVFAMHCLGLPLHGSPLAFLHPQLPVEIDAHPSEEGRGGCGWRFLIALQVEGMINDKSRHVQKRDT
jgi:hypothetical protein